MPHTCHDDHCTHDHTSDLPPALQTHLHAQIDFPHVRTLNESTLNTGRQILEKPWQDRLTSQPELVSSADEQLLMHVPFTGQTLRVYANNEDLDFATAEDTPPTQVFELSLTREVQDLNVKRQLFNSTRCLALFFVDNWSAGEEEETRVGYVGFKGDFMRLSREPVEVLYEAASRPSDHKVEGTKAVGAKQGF